MPRRGRRRGSSQGAIARTLQGSIRRSSTSRGNSRQPSRRSARILSLLESAEIASLAESISQNTHESSQISSSHFVNSENQPRQNLSQQGLQASGPAQDREISGSTLDHQLAEIRDEEQHIETEDLMSSITDRGRQSSDAYSLTILVQPPNQARPGRRFYQPIIVRVEQRSGQNPRGTCVSEPSLLWAWISLVAADDETVILGPSLLQGNPVDSLQGLEASVENGVTEWSDRVAGYASFSNIAIREPGRYRIRISLVHMNVIANLSETALEGGVNLQNTMSRMIRVDSSASPLAPG